MKKDWFSWQTHRLPVRGARGALGPLRRSRCCCFPTAGGDCEEVERMR